MKRVLILSLGWLLAFSAGRTAAQDKTLTVPKEGLSLNGIIGKDDPKVKIDLPPAGSKAQEMAAKTYLVQFQAGKRYRIEMNSKELDPFLALQNQAGTQIAFDDDSGGFPNALLFFDSFKGGTFKVVAAAFLKTGPFALAIKEEGAVKVYDVGPGLKLKEQISPQAKTKTFNVNLVQGKTYIINMVSATPATLDPFLRLYNEDGKELAYDDDSGGFPHARLTFPAPATGTYRIVGRSFLETGTGEFTLEVKEK